LAGNPEVIQQVSRRFWSSKRFSGDLMCLAIQNVLLIFESVLRFDIF